MRKSILLLVLPVIFISQCARVPVTGRTQLKLISNDVIIPMSFDEYKKVKETATVITEGNQVEMVKKAGSRIQKAVEVYFKDLGKENYLTSYEWEFNLIEDDKTANAWCMPGGKVAFYTGIMPICQDETGVAVVMGHEIAHAIANHGRERVSQTVAAQTGLSIVSIALGGGASTLTGEMIMQGAGAVTSMGILKFSRKHESEADEMGLYFMAMAGYDPNAAPAFWERMAGEGGDSPPEFLSTHPSHDTRISDLKKNIPKAMEYYNKYN